MIKNMISTNTVHIIFSRKDISLSGAFTSGITLTKGDSALRNNDVMSLHSPAGVISRIEIDLPFKNSGRPMIEYQM